MVCHISQIGSHCFDCFQQHPLHTAKRLTDFAQYALPTNKLSVVFKAFLSFVVTALSVTRPLPLATVFDDVESVASEMFNTDVMFAEDVPVCSQAL